MTNFIWVVLCGEFPVSFFDIFKCGVLIKT